MCGRQAGKARAFEARYAEVRDLPAQQENIAEWPSLVRHLALNQEIS
jgi:hypothetical protein